MSTRLTDPVSSAIVVSEACMHFRSGKHGSFAFGLLLLVGCGPNPLVGHWSVSSADISTTLALNSNGSASYTVTGSQACMGTLVISGLTWSSSDTNITFNGTPACTGAVVCTSSGTSVTVDCSSAAMLGTQNGRCMYSFGTSGNTLTITNCEGTTSGTTTYVRAM